MDGAADLFGAPELELVDQEVLRLIDELRVEMGGRMPEPCRWVGTLRRMTFVRAARPPRAGR